MTPEQQAELEEHLFIFGVSYFDKKESRVIHPKRVRRISNDSGFFESEDWLSEKSLKNVRRHNSEDIIFEMLHS